MGSEMFRKVQYGKETVRGTAVAATQMFMGSSSVPKDRDPKFVEDTLGLRARAARIEIGQILASPIPLLLPNAYYQALPLLFGTLLRGGVTATETTGGQADYAWDFSPSLTAAAAPDTITLEVGDNDQAYEMEYVMGSKLNFQWDFGSDAFMQISWEGFGRQVTKTTFTAGLTRPTVNSILANSGKFWLDSTWATLGTTQKTGFLRAGNLTIEPGNHPKYLGSGNKTFDSYGEGPLDVSGTLTVEGGAEAVARFDDYQAGTARAMRMQWEGPQIGTGVNHQLRLDVFGGFSGAIPFASNRDGNVLYDLNFVGITDNLATPHLLGARVITNRNSY